MAARAAAWGALVCHKQREGVWFYFFSGSESGSVGSFCFSRVVGGVGDGSSDGNDRRQWQTVSGGAGNSVRDSGSTGDGGWRERGKSEAARTAE